MTVRDLLMHSSGLMRTDLGWYTGALSTEEAIQIYRDLAQDSEAGARRIRAPEAKQETAAA